jgi:antitoxin component YwqK of YwqJK toxin-antitoxin module
MDMSSSEFVREGDVKKGQWSYWRENGSMERVESYNAAGQLHGLQERYSLSGTLESSGKYKNGKPNGAWKYYHPHGAIMRDCTFKNGMLNGLNRIYDERGRILEESHYKNNKLHGLYTRYSDKSGKVELKQEYENGRVIKVLEGKPGRQ